MRPATVEDLTSILLIESSSFPDPWSGAVWRDELSRSGSIVFVAGDCGVLAGYVAARCMGKEGEVLRLAVHPEHRRHGLGGRLFRAAADALFAAGATSLFLEVRADNTSAVAFYSGLALREVGRRLHYYPDGVDALVLRCDLSRGSTAMKPALSGSDSRVLS